MLRRIEQRYLKYEAKCKQIVGAVLAKTFSRLPYITPELRADLSSAAWLGVAVALKHFRESKGRFESFCFYWVRCQVISELKAHILACKKQEILEQYLPDFLEGDFDEDDFVMEKSMSKNELLFYRQIKAGILLPTIKAGFNMGREEFRALKYSVSGILLKSKSPFLPPEGGLIKIKKKAK